ncbi:MAG: hypothetical protein RR348_04815, partial [Clostridia bacterium]
MAKKKSSKVATFVGLFVVLLGALAACALFMPYISAKLTSLIGNSEATTISGLEFVKCLFNGNKITADGNFLIKMFVGIEKFSTATYAVEIGAVASAGCGLLMVFFGFFYMITKSKLMRMLTIISSFLTFAGGLAAMISVIVIGKALSVDAVIAGTLVSVSAGSIIAMCAGFVGFVGMV